MAPLWPFRRRKVSLSQLSQTSSLEEGVSDSISDAGSLPRERQRVSALLQSGKEELPGSYTLLVTRLSIMLILSVLTASIAFSTWYYTNLTARSIIESTNRSYQRNLLSYASNTFSVYVNNTCQPARALSSLIEAPGVINADVTAFDELRSELAPLLFSVLRASQGTTAVRFLTTDGLMLAYRRTYPGLTFLFSNGTSALPDSSGYSAPNWYTQNADEGTGSMTSVASQTNGLDYRNNSVYLETVQTGQVEWDIEWSQQDSLVFHCAQVVKDAVTNRVLGVAMGTSTVDALGETLRNLRPAEGVIYVTKQTTGQLLSSSDVDKLWNYSQPISEDDMLATKSSDGLVRDSARFLLASARELGWPGVQSAQYDSVKLQNQDYYISALNFSVGEDAMTGVMAIPRSLFWSEINRRSHRVLTAIGVVTSAVLVAGCLLSILVTSRVSKELMLRTELIRQLAATRRAEKASDYKSQFLAAMSHDVRTPLCCIIGLLEVLLCDGRLNREQRGSLKQIRHCALQLLDLLKSILDLSKVETGKLTLEPEPFDLGQELEAMVDMFAVQCAQKKVALVLDLDDRLPRKVIGDCARVRQILANLIGNSCKFTNSGYIVVRAWPLPSASTLAAPGSARAREFQNAAKRFGKFIGVSKSGQPMQRSDSWADQDNRTAKVRIAFEVDDTGIGIPPHLRPTVLGSFIQGSRPSGGYGLGLAMVRTLVELMGGKIKILNKSGPGTLFRFDLGLEVSVGRNGQQPSGSESPQGLFDTPRASHDTESSRQRHRSSRGDTPNRGGNTPLRLASVATRIADDSNDDNRTAVKRPPEFLLRSGDVREMQLPMDPTVNGSAILLLKSDRVGRGAAAGWMQRRGLRVYQAARWEGMRESLGRILRGDEPVSILSDEADVGTVNTAAESSVNGDAIAGVNGSDMREEESDSEGDSDRRVLPRAVLMILDASIIPGSPSPEAIWSAFTSLMLAFDLTAPNAPRVGVSWLVSVAVPGPTREQMRASGCRIMASDVLHPSRLLSLLSTMVSTDLAIPDMLLNGSFGSSERLDNIENDNLENSNEEVMIRAGVAFTSGRGVVDERGPTPDAYSPHGKLSLQASFSKIDAQPTTTSVLREPPALEEKAAAERPPAKTEEQKKKQKECLDGKGPLDGTHILVVEDTVLLRKLAVSILTKLGAQVFAVEDGRQAVRSVRFAMDWGQEPPLSPESSSSSAAPPPESAASVTDSAPPETASTQTVPVRDAAALSETSSDVSSEKSFQTDGGDAAADAQSTDALSAALERSGPFSLVLMDCQMPVLDGYGATQEIRELERAKGGHVPIVALTAHAMKQDEEKCLNIGMDGYLTKPINVKLLVATIRKFVQAVEHADH